MVNNCEFQVTYELTEDKEVVLRHHSGYCAEIVNGHGNKFYYVPKDAGINILSIRVGEGLAELVKAIALTKSSQVRKLPKKIDINVSCNFGE